ncbi:hypothetical protein [Haloarchaeobius sp. HME9146]|uniref:hypothetical protein n=1 Tax=Haloarchaeobius sp. HME9146 TaxID=2978732 RepID=UPI0021BEB8B6|nr:hypothetical protein [Haloarchaeobius sp. HME9146]MCT9095154.1 hypothetical protein [Haloarchaeobius sp. HME9146]
MPTRESEPNTGSTGELSDVVDAFDVETVEEVIEDNDTGDSEVADPDAVFDSLLDADGSTTAEERRLDHEPPVTELDGAFAAVETELDHDEAPDRLGRWLAYDGFDFADEQAAPTATPGPSAHEEFKSLAAESETVDLDDLDLDDLALGDGTVAASLDIDMPAEEDSLAEAMLAGDEEVEGGETDVGETGGGDSTGDDSGEDAIDETGFDWD